MQPPQVGRSEAEHEIYANRSYQVVPYEAVTGDLQSSPSSDLDSFLNIKSEQASYRIQLILAEIYARKRIADENIEMIEQDMLRVRNLFLDLPFPKNYYRDKLWQDLHKMSFALREQIRAERRECAKDSAMLFRDLRESILELRLQKKKTTLFMDDGNDRHGSANLEHLIDEP